MKNQPFNPNVFVTNTTHPSQHLPEKLSEHAFYLIALAVSWRAYTQTGNSSTDLKQEVQSNKPL